MIKIRVSGDAFDPIVDYLESLAFPDLMPLAHKIADIMVQDNREGLLAGTDWNDDRMGDLMPSTIKTRGGSGPPLIPRGEASAAIADYRVDPYQESDRILLVGTWPSTPYIHFHVTGTVNMVARDPTGVRAAGRERIASALHDEITALIGGRP